MEAFSLLKYWRDGGGSTGDAIGANSSASVTTTVAHSATDTDDDDDGPFFDLEISVDAEDDEGEVGIDGRNCQEGDNVSEFGAEEEEDEEEEAAEFNLTLSSASSSTDVNLSLSPSDDLFFKGRLVPIVEPSLAGTGDSNSNTQFPVSLKKSATKFRVFMRGLKKSKPEGQAQELVPVKSLLTRENSSGNQIHPPEGQAGVSDDKRFSREAVQRYLKKVKPLYFRRYGQNMRFSFNLPAAVKASPEEAAEDIEPPIIGASLLKMPKANTLPSALRETVSKHLRKSRSASSSAAVAAAPSSSRRDDSLLELQDGIQGAIQHCKRSFNLITSSTSSGSESSMFLRSVSDPLLAKPTEPPPSREFPEEEADKRECCV